MPRFSRSKIGISVGSWKSEIGNFFSRVPLKRCGSLASLTVILTIHFFFGLQHIGSFITADEHYWVDERIPQYWEAWSEGKWRKTLINDKPGISLALISGPALLLNEKTALRCEEKDGWFSGCDPEKTSALYASFRIPILLLNGVFLVLIFLSIRVISGPIVAAASAGLMALSPNLLGISQIINPDAILWSSGSTAIFAFLAFLKSGRKPYAFLSVAALTFALLSKYTAIIIIFFLPFVALSIRFLDPGFSPIPLKKKLASLVGISTIPFLLFPMFVPGVLSSEERITAFLTAGTGSFLPWIGYAALLGVLTAVAVLRIPKKTEVLLRNTTRYSLRIPAVAFVGLAVWLVIGRMTIPNWNIFTAIPFDIKDLTNARYYLPDPLSPLDIAFLEISPFIYGLPLVTALFALFAVVLAAVSKKRDELPITLILTFFVILLIAALGFSNVFAIPRYVILAFPIASYIAALGMKEAWELLPKRSRSGKFPIILAGIVALVSLGSLLSSKPYYANFANMLLPKTSLISHSWGYGGYEAAMYLNALPDARNTTIWSDYYGVCEFFVGRCLTAYTFDPKIAPDYYVLTRRGQLRYMPKYEKWEEKSGLVAYQYYDRTDPLWSLSINGKNENFVKVFRVDNELRASVITDIDHCVSRAPVPESLFGNFTSFSDETGSDFIISLGDNISHRLQGCSKTAATDLPYVMNRLDRARAEDHYVLGDHDLGSSKESYQLWLSLTGRESTYYSFDTKGAHIVVLDTITGGEPIVQTCEESSECDKSHKEKAKLDAILRDPKLLSAYLAETGKSRAETLTDRANITKHYRDELAVIHMVRDASDRDRGMVLDRELDWLEADLARTSADRVIVFSDHPLIPFSSPKKSYDILNGATVREILEKSGKEVVAISGEAHLWHEEERNGIRYFIVNQFRASPGGTWASVSWDKTGFRFERVER